MISVYGSEYVHIEYYEVMPGPSLTWPYKVRQFLQPRRPDTLAASISTVGNNINNKNNSIDDQLIRYSVDIVSGVASSVFFLRQYNSLMINLPVATWRRRSVLSIDGILW